MAELSRAFVDGYARALSGCASSAVSFFEEGMRSFFDEHELPEVKDVREAALSLIAEADDAYGGAAAELSAAMFAEVASAEGVRARASSWSYAANRAAHRQSVGGFAEKLKSNDRAGFVAACAARLSDKVFAASDAALDKAVSGTKGKVRFALVPQSATACSLCFDRAANGFHFNTATAARHDGCRCAVVPGVRGKTTIDGSDPDVASARRDAFKRINAYVDPDTGEGLSRAEMRYLYDGFDEGGDVAKMLNAVQMARRTLAWDGNRDGASVVSELARRDRTWFLTGKVDYCDSKSAGRMYEKFPGAKPLDKEKKVARILSENGFKVRFIKEINTTHVKTADAYLCDEVWEFKVPEGWSAEDDGSAVGEHTVRKQFQNAMGKGTRLILVSNTENDAPAKDLLELVKKTLATKSGDFDEALVVTSDGEVFRIFAA